MTIHEHEGLSDDAIQTVLELAQAGRLDTLVIDDLTKDDLPKITWSGTPSHIRSVDKALDRASHGDVEYLAVRAPGGLPVAKGGIDYAAHRDSGMLYQLATATPLQGLGLGTRLIAEAERRIRRRGCLWAMLGVEDENPRARALYERIGYEFWRRSHASWQQEDAQGNLQLYVTELNLLRKPI